MLAHLFYYATPEEDPLRRVNLDLQANRIEAVLATHRAPVRVTGGVVTPRTVRFHLAPAPWVRLRRLLGLAEEVALALDVPSCRIARDHGTLAIELPRADPSPVALLPLCARLTRIPSCAAILGLDQEGTPLVLALAGPDVAHVLIAGSTGSGKTALARAMVASLAAHNHLGQVQFVLMDPKGRGLLPFEGLPHLLCPVLSDPGPIGERLSWLVQEMSRRDREGIMAPRLVVVIDELAEVIGAVGSPAIEALTRLTQRGREAGIHVVAGTQKPSASLLGPLMKANFPVRLVGSVTSADDARVAAGLAGTQAERLLGRGDFLLVHRGQCCRFQAAYIAADEVRSLVARLREGGRTSRRWLLPARAAGKAFACA
ncbi:MAG: DNA translocase FtsK [Anaerolineae bacterium]|nr:DNA translocase FtsK [Anaerolineae bacterium]